MLKIKFLLLFLFTTLICFGNTPQSESQNWIEETLENMTLEEKIGQLFMIAVYSNKDRNYEDNIESIITKYNIGGLIFFQGDPVRQVLMTNRYQENTKYPLLIGMDAEHGIGWRLQNSMEFPKMLINGAISNDSLIYELAAAIARHCREIGVHVNFAPVADINNNPRNPVIGVRSFGEDKENVYNKSKMYIAGSLSENVLPVLKHFPGHGDTETDSHHALPIISYSRERLDSLELYPFRKLIEEHAPAIMIGHLNTTALDSSDIPASLSPRIVKGLLQEEWGFDGLSFTDAMNMKGVTQGLESGEADLKALMAGNDILLFPENVERAIRKIKQAISDNVISEDYINAKCRKILEAKYKYVVPYNNPIDTTNLWNRLNTADDIALKQDLYKSALTLVINKDDLLPLKRLDTLKFASINFGGSGINNFQQMLSKYEDFNNMSVAENISEAQLKELANKLDAYNCIIIYNNKASSRPTRQFGYSPTLAKLIESLQGKRIILCHPAIPYGLEQYVDLPVDALIVSYENHTYSRHYAAQGIFGGISMTGKLPVSINNNYPAGFGINTPKTRLGYITPEMLNLSSALLYGIDSICNWAIQNGATPGCQVLVAKDNYIIYNKAFGHHTYDKKVANSTSDIYDLASITKIAATTPAIMKLYEEEKIDLNKPLSNYYPPLKTTNKKNITFRQLLTHTAGLKSSIAFFYDLIDKSSLPGSLFSTTQNANNTVKLKDNLYGYPNYQFKDDLIVRKAKENYEEVLPGLYIANTLRDSIITIVMNSDLRTKKNYLYSDLGYIMLPYVVNEITNLPIDQFCKEYFYNRLGAYNTDFLAIERLDMDKVVPSSFDNFYRKSEIKGYVHDPTAALLGGVAGHAGLFSNAEDLAKIMSLYLNYGTYGDEIYLDTATVKLFTNRTNLYPSVRRGLGFDKPEPDKHKVSPTSKETPLSTFGHTGFTGTAAWADPDNQLIYIFLSNRTYPSEFNTKLTKYGIRSEIQTVIYETLKFSAKN